MSLITQDSRNLWIEKPKQEAWHWRTQEARHRVGNSKANIELAKLNVDNALTRLEKIVSNGQKNQTASILIKNLKGYFSTIITSFEETMRLANNFFDNCLYGFKDFKFEKVNSTADFINSKLSQLEEKWQGISITKNIAAETFNFDTQHIETVIDLLVSNAAKALADSDEKNITFNAKIKQQGKGERRQLVIEVSHPGSINNQEKTMIWKGVDDTYTGINKAKTICQQHMDGSLKLTSTEDPITFTATFCEPSENDMKLLNTRA